MSNQVVHENEEATPERQEKIGFWSLMLSVLAAAIGVQNKKNLEKDFHQSSPYPYIVAGIIFTVVFVFILIFVVKIVLSQ